MTKKDFELIASIIKNLYCGHGDWQRTGQQTAEKFASLLSERYPKFDTKRFIDACLKTKCPKCKQEIWDSAIGYKLNKCHNCNLAFDSMSDDE